MRVLVGTNLRTGGQYRLRSARPPERSSPLRSSGSQFGRFAMQFVQRFVRDSSNPLFSGRTRANLEASEPPAQLGYGTMSSHRLGQTPRGQSSAGRSLCRRLWISQVVVTNPDLLGSRGFDRRLAGRASPIHRGLFLSGAGAPAEMPAETGSWLLWSGFAPLQIQVNRPS